MHLSGKVVGWGWKQAQARAWLDFKEIASVKIAFVRQAHCFNIGLTSKRSIGVRFWSIVVGLGWKLGEFLYYPNLPNAENRRLFVPKIRIGPKFLKLIP